MKERSANSYDLKQAQQMLNAFFPASGASRGVQPPAETPHYLRISKDALPRAASRPAVAAIAGAHVHDGASSNKDLYQQLSSWEECVDWCMNLTQAEAVFVVDSQGFIIASRGKAPGQGFEGTGAELICSVEQMERIAPEAGKLLWLDLAFDAYRVVGFITPPVDAEYYVLGLIAPFNSHKQTITRNLLENLPLD